MLVRREPIFEQKIKSGGNFTNQVHKIQNFSWFLSSFLSSLPLQLRVPFVPEGCMGLTSPFLMCSSLQKVESELWPSAELCQTGTCYTQPKNGPRFSYGCRLRVAEAGMSKTRFFPPSTPQVSSYQGSKEILWGVLAANVSKKHFLILSQWPSETVFLLERSSRGLCFTCRKALPVGSFRGIN